MGSVLNLNRTQWNQIPDQERIAIWKEFRVGISSDPIEIQLSKIAQFVSSLPYGSRSIDYYSPDSWPTPWEILYHNSLCVSSISLLVYYTLVLTNPDIEIDLLLIDNSDDVFLLPLIEGKYLLNYYPNTVVELDEIEQTIQIVQKFSKNDIRSIK